MSANEPSLGIVYPLCALPDYRQQSELAVVHAKLLEVESSPV
jgi:hypothetical protein